VSDEWYRGPRWDRDDRAEFERRLSRARDYNRPQYLRIKALALWQAGKLDEACDLLLRVTAEYAEAIDAPSATEMLGDIARQQGRTADAESFYRSVLKNWPSLSSTTWMVEVSLAELLIDRGGESAYTEALQLLDSRLARGLMFNSDLFRWNVALARVAVSLGDVETQRQAARTALSLADRGPQLPRHPTVGLVNTDKPTLTWLRRLATDG
jgi:predicted Zn-dependent protease